MNNLAFFEIQATEPVKAAHFYREVFGWGLTQQPGMPIEHWRIVFDEATRAGTATADRHECFCLLSRSGRL